MESSIRKDVPDKRLDGKIALCPHQGCAFKCCDFQQDEYIVLYPGELEAAIAAGSSVRHLQITESYHGGFKAVCRARDTSTCDYGYKPLDCKSYPYFPTIEQGEIRAGLKGKKCPLTPALTRAHAKFVEYQWRQMAEEKPEVIEWLKRVTMVGYENL